MWNCWKWSCYQNDRQNCFASNVGDYWNCYYWKCYFQLCYR